MTRPTVLIKRSLIFVHRWLGVALSLLFLLWFASGIVMMYWDFPGVSAADRLEHSPALDPALIKLSPQEALAKIENSPAPTQVRLNTFDGRPVYRFRAGRGESMVYADDGSEQIEVSDEMIARVASAWTAQPAAAAKREEVTEVDQWTVAGGLRNLRPLYKYSWPDGQQTYISGASGEVVQYTTRESRFWAYLGAIPHWLYFTPLRKNQPQWSQFVIWSSGIGTVASILGIAIGIWMYSPARRYRYAGSPTSIPYRGQKRWHTIFGLIFGLTATTWAFSGMLSMDPFPQREGRRQRTADFTAALRGRLALAKFDARHPREAIAAAALNRDGNGAGGEFKTKELELTMIAGEPVYLANDGSGASRIVPMQGDPISGVEPSHIIEILQKAAGSTLAEVRVMDQYDAYYLDRHGRRPLPVVLARLNDESQTRYYIDPKTARVVGNYSSRNWVNRWLYHGLHSLDFPWLYRYRPLWDIVVIVLMLGGTSLCVTSLILAWRVLKRKLVASMSRPGTSSTASVPSEDLVEAE